LEFADGLELAICNALFWKEEFKPVSCAAGSVKSIVDYVYALLVIGV